VADRASLIIAVESFSEAGPPVTYAATDCAEFHRVLPAVGYNPQKCILISGSRTTKAVIESHLKRLPKLIGTVDSLLVFIVSRGFTHKGRGYLVCTDTINPDLTGTSLPIADLFEAIDRTKCQEVTFLLDIDSLIVPGEIVRAGLDEAELTKLFNAYPGYVGLLSTKPGGRSFESAQSRSGIWRHHLIESFSGKTSRGVGPDGFHSAASLQTFLLESVPQTLRKNYDLEHEQIPVLFGEQYSFTPIADLGQLLGEGRNLLDPARLKRVVFRSESVSRVKDLLGFRKTHTLPDRANEWARKYVNRIAVADLKADLDTVFDMVRAEFGYKRKDLDVAADRDGCGFIRTPDFEYVVSLALNPDEPTEVIWRREIGRLSGLEFIRSDGFQAVFSPMFDQLVFEFASSVNIGEFVDHLEDSPPDGVKIAVESDGTHAEITLTGFAGKVTLTPSIVTIQGQPGNTGSLLEQFLVFLRKLTRLGEPKALLPGDCI
jgi:hypothetical protein